MKMTRRFFQVQALGLSLEPSIKWLIAIVTVWLPMVSVALAFSAEPDQGKSRIVSFTRYMPQLNHDKRIWVYLPPDYGVDRRKRFPVIYMQDGQHLFDPALMGSVNPYIDEGLQRELQRESSRYGSWQVDKRLDQLFVEKQAEEVIVVGISSANSNRTGEYSPWAWSGASLPNGDQYVEFIVHTLKPYIDNRYLTLRGRDHTAIAGSSMGGLLALYASLKYPDIFSKVAAFSPVLTRNVFGQRLVEYIDRQRKSHAMKIYVDLGSAESSFGPLEPIRESLRVAGFVDRELWFRHIPQGEHRVDHWGERFPQALLWLYGPSGTETIEIQYP